MKKIISFILAVFGCCCFSASAYAEGQPEQGAETTTSSVVSATEITTTTTRYVPSAESFAGAVKLTFDEAPTNKPVSVAVSVEGATLTEGDVIRWRQYSALVTNADADPNIIWQDYTAPFEIAENSTVEAAVFFADGSRSASAVANIACIDMIAPTAPQIQPSTAEWTKGPVEITVTGGSDEQSGLLRLEYRIGSDGTWTEYTGVFSIPAPTAVYARSVDAAGNTSEAAMLEVNNFDTAAPDVNSLSVALSATGNPAIAESGAFSKYFGSDVTLNIDGASDNASGIGSYQYQLVNGSDSVKEDKWQNYDPARPPVVSGDFCGYVYARALDKVGNVSGAVSSEGFVIDVTPPVVENIQLSETAITGNRVVVTFNVKDNYWLETVTVNGVYAGVYVSTFTAFRNDDYLIVAVDKVGNRTEQLVQITNINATPFTLLDTWKSMNPQDFTPTSWAAAEKAANELQTLITVDAPQSQIEAAAGQLLNALEALVGRGDGTLSAELIERIKAYDSAAYTESSWARVEEGIVLLETCLNDPESTQESVDSCRRSLEQRLAELVKLGDFTDLDRLIAQCERMNTDSFSASSYKNLMNILDFARELSRTDSSQADADQAYQNLLAAMGGLEVRDEGGFDPAPIVYVVMGLLIVAAGTALLIVRMRARSILAAAEADEDDSDDSSSESGESSFGDIHFTDDSVSDAPAEETHDYIGSRNKADRQ